MLPLRKKVQAMFLGIAIGDGLGKAVETMTPEEIVQKYPQTNGRITDYLAPTGHKWFDGHLPGSTTDDYQLSCAIADAIAKSGLSIDAQVLTHVEAFKKSSAGWGGTTRDAVRALANGASYTRSGISGKNRGKGNGCAMKIAPVAVYVVNYHKKHPDIDIDEYKRFMLTIYTFTMRLSLMTHATLLGVQSAIAQQVAVSYCLSPFCDFDDGNKFDEHQFITLLLEGVAYAKHLVESTGHSVKVDRTSDLLEQLSKLHNYTEYDVARCRAEFGGGSCYISHSLPFTYMFFLRNPSSIDSLYDIISAGGDTDTNGSMLGALLGALHGPQIFPSHLIEGLVEKDEIISTANRLCDALEIE